MSRRPHQQAPTQNSQEESMALRVNAIRRYLYRVNSRYQTDFFIGRAIVNLRRSSGIRGKTQEFARGLEPVQLKQHWKSQQISSLLFYLSPSKMRGWFYQNHKNPSVVFCGCTMDIVMFAFEVLLPSTG